jgi:hypothetical protein
MKTKQYSLERIGARHTINTNGQQLAGVHIYIAVYQFAMVYGRSQSNSTTRSSDNDLEHRGLRIGKEAEES